MTDTTPLGLLKPDILGDEDQWGQETNQNWDKVDALTTQLQAADALRVLKSGDTMTGGLTVVEPTAPGMATSKNYVDTQLAGLPASAAPLMDGAAAVGASARLAREDHVHPSDVSRYAASNPSNYQSDSQVALSIAGQVAFYVPLTQRAAANGVATLDASGRIPTAQLPASATGTLSYKGGWNASTNVPAMTSGALVGGVPAPIGDYYVVTVAGTTSVDGVASWSAGDWISSNGTIWQRVQNSSTPYLPLTGGTLTSPGTVAGIGGLTFTSNDTMLPANNPPDFAWSLRDPAGNIAVALDLAGVLNAASVAATTEVVTTSTIVTLTATTGTVTTLTSTIATLANEQIRDQPQPDLIGTVQGSNGNVVSGYDTVTGEFNVVSVNAGAVKVNGAPITVSTPKAPTDALDVASAPYNAAGDASTNHGYVTTSGNTLTVTNFTGTLTLTAIDATTSRLQIVGARYSGWSFQFRHTGKLLYLVVGAYTLLARVKTYETSQSVVLDNTGSTITPQAGVTGSLTCPAVDTTMSTANKYVIVEGMGQSRWWQQSPTVAGKIDTVTPYGLVTFGQAITGFPAANQITIGVTALNPSGVFPFAWTNVPTRIVWGTNDSAAAIACALDAFPHKRRIWFSGDGKTYLLAGCGTENASKYPYLPSPVGNAGPLLNGVLWGADNAVVHALANGCSRLPNRASPAWAPRYNDSEKLFHGPQSFPRCAQIPKGQPINVLFDGDSLSAMDPQTQVALVMGASRFIQEFVKQNPQHPINFYNIGVGGATWASLANPHAAYNSGSGGPMRYYVIPKPVAGTVTKFSFYANINQTGVGPAIVPDVVVMFCCAGNDKISYDLLSMQVVLNTIRNVTHADSYGPTDIVMQTDHHALMTVFYNDGISGGVLAPGSSTAVLQEFYNTGMNRTYARNNGYPFVDYLPLQDRAAFGFDPTRRAMRQVPQRTIGPTPAAPVSIAEDCLDFSTYIAMTGANDDATWAALQQIELQISSNPGNRLFIRRQPDGHIWMASSSIGLAIDSVVTIAAGSTSLTVGAATTYPANVTFYGGYPQASTTDASITFTAAMQDKCVIARTGNYMGATYGYDYQRNYIRTVIDASDVLLHEITHDVSDVAVNTLTIGANQFVPQDGQGMPDIVIFYPDGTIFQTKVAWGGYVSATQVTLADPAPQALTGATVSLFVGRMGLKWFDTGLTLSTTTNTGAFAVTLSGGTIAAGYSANTTTDIPMWSVQKTVERFGGNFNVVVYVKNAATMTLLNRWVDDDHPIAASTPAWFQRGIASPNSDYDQGGTGGHYGSATRAVIFESLYSNQNLSVN